MRIPFSLPLTIGTDIIAYHRLIRPNTSSQYLQRLASRFLHPHELRGLNKRFPDWSSSESFTSEQQFKIGTYLAGRWAAKEAAKKAWGATLISFKDLRIETLSDGQVQIVCQSFNNGGVHPGQDVCEDMNGHEQVAKLSISHDGDYAVATVIATPLHPDIVKDLQARKAKAESMVMEGKK